MELATARLAERVRSVLSEPSLSNRGDAVAARCDARGTGVVRRNTAPRRHATQDATPQVPLRGPGRALPGESAIQTEHT